MPRYSGFGRGEDSKKEKKVRVAIIQFRFLDEGEWHRKRVLDADTTPWTKLWTLIMLPGFAQWIMDALRGSVGVSMFVCLFVCLSDPLLRKRASPVSESDRMRMFSCIHSIKVETSGKHKRRKEGITKLAYLRQKGGETVYRLAEEYGNMGPVQS